MSKDWDPDSLFEVFGDELARQVLVMASEQPVSAEAIAEHSQASLPTVYRRLDALEELDLLDERVHVEDGTQFREYETSLKRISFEINDGGFDIDIRIRQDISDRFQAFWEGLDQGSGEDVTPSPDTEETVRGDSDRG